ncbi:MAG: hypothetical protein UV05_C0054G0007 [candidate division CPR1 bacterium GW2011_GWA2_42_17]|uniref:HTH cro/C1-type domain-containing protein n=1 Tax=candidate division CPR1 bacterium GW2011_GWA2_42_17 TaxID=1618341 RepID=A0A0G0YY39_9BACT|nr:MAG: hypothetical protein UV05_C0054G0007 [candidate division CPR1 bacterium GW2011_GWA2_42_17]
MSYDSAKLDLSAQKSSWWGDLSEFGETVLKQKRQNLGLTQQQVAKIVGLNQSQISRIEQGLSRPSDPPTLDSIAKAYHLNQKEKEYLYQLFVGVETIKTKIGESLTPVLDLLDKQTSFIAHANRSGNPQVASDHAKSIREWISKTKGLFGKSIWNTEFPMILSRLLLEESAAIWDIVSPKELKFSTAALLKTQQEITEKAVKEYIKRESGLFLLVNKSFHHYIAGNYQKALIGFLQVVNSTELKKSHWYIEVLRGILVTSGVLKDLGKLKSTERQVKTFIEKSSPSRTNHFYLLEGLARGYKNFDPAYSLKLLEEAWGLMTKARRDDDYLLIREVQLVRTALMALIAAGESRPTALEEIATPTLNLCQKHGFFRHEQQIIELINQPTI